MLRASGEYGALSESTFEVSWRRKKACGAASCGKTGVHAQVTTEKTQADRTDHNDER